LKIVVFGSTGQIGYALVEHFSKMDNQFTVTAVKRESNPLIFPANVSTHCVKGLNQESFASALRNSDHAVYAIGSPEQWVGNQDYFRQTNVDILREFLLAIKGFPRLTVSYISTYEVFAARSGICSESYGYVEKGPTPYYQSMIDALELVRRHESENGTKFIIIHPAALYGGLNTGLGITNYLLNLRSRNYLGTPSILPGKFPIVHVDSLSNALCSAIQKGCYGEGFNVSDAYLSLKDLAIAARKVFPKAYQPLELPAWLVNASAHLMDFISHSITRRPPILSAVQVLYITKSFDIDCTKAKLKLGWSPMSIGDGITRLFTRYQVHSGS
jgi:nucleoside-diphosphate-sugar epimerase